MNAAKNQRAHTYTHGRTESFTLDSERKAAAENYSRIQRQQCFRHMDWFIIPLIVTKSRVKNPSHLISHSQNSERANGRNSQISPCAGIRTSLTLRSVCYIAILWLMFAQITFRQQLTIKENKMLLTPYYGRLWGESFFRLDIIVRVLFHWTSGCYDW